MKGIFFILFVSILSANNLSSVAIKKLEFKGSKIAKLFCKQEALPKDGSIEQIVNKLKTSKVCGNLDNDKLKAVAYYIKSKKSSTFKVPNGAKCPVCGMFVYKYPKWAAHMVIKNKDYYFDGVKDMLKFYFFDEDFKYNRDDISKVEVRDYYSLESIDAKDAFYVIDSKVYGPMGKELIPFKSLKEAKAFIADHGGRVIKLKDTNPKMILDLDK